MTHQLSVDTIKSHSDEEKKAKESKMAFGSSLTLSSSSRHLDLILHNILLLQPQHDGANSEREKSERESERENAKKYGLSKYKRLMWPFRSKNYTHTHTHAHTNFAHFSNNLSKSKRDLAGA